MRTFIGACLAAKALLNCRHPRCIRVEVYELLYQALYGVKRLG